MSATRAGRVRVTDESDSGRRASWLELFFDLVFVASIAQLAHALGHDLTWPGLGRLVLLFVPVWWAWSNYSIYCDRFERDDARHRLAMFAAMGAMAAVAVTIPRAFDGGSTAFVLSYIAMRLPLIALWNRARRGLPEVRPLATYSMLAFTTGTALWTLSLLFAEPVRYALWFVALALEMATPWVFRRAFTGTPLHESHLAERWGLFTIIVLGESFLSVILASGDIPWTVGSVLTAVFCFATVAAGWWVYFSFSAEAALSRSLWTRNMFIYGHLPLTLGLATGSVGIKAALLAAGDGHHAGLAVLALGGGYAMYLLSLAAIRAAATGGVTDRFIVTKVVGALALGGVAALGGQSAPAAGASVAVLLIALVLGEAGLRDRRPRSSRTEQATA